MRSVWFGRRDSVIYAGDIDRKHTTSTGHTRLKQLEAKGIESAFPVKYFWERKSLIALENKQDFSRHDHDLDISTGESIFLLPQ